MPILNNQAYHIFNDGVVCEFNKKYTEAYSNQQRPLIPGPIHVNMPLVASTGPVLAQCGQYWHKTARLWES